MVPSNPDRARLTLLTLQEVDYPPTFTYYFFSEIIKAFESSANSDIYHSIRVSVISWFIGKKLGFDNNDINELFVSAILHDIGGLSKGKNIADSISMNPDPFSQKTNFYIFSHTHRGHYFLRRFPTLRKVADIVFAHHEFFNGTGFPLGLKEEKIPLAARIIRIADSVDITLRNYEINTVDELTSFLSITLSDEFDPSIYKNFEKLLEENDFFEKIKDPAYIEKKFEAVVKSLRDDKYLYSTDTINRLFENIAILTDSITSHEKNHSLRVAEFAEKIVMGLDFDTSEVINTRWSAFLHDIGKIKNDHSVYSKKTKLTTHDWDVIYSHPKLSYSIVNNVPGMEKIAYYVLYHHENFDGSGYPEGLSGEKIPLISRVLRVADAFEAMTSEQIYQRKRDWQLAMKELSNCAGKQFDPKIVELFTNIYN